jgi:hypothetical protein
MPCPSRAFGPKVAKIEDPEFWTSTPHNQILVLSFLS